VESSDVIVSEAQRIAEQAKSKGLTLRVIGACAFRIHCPRYLNVHKAIGRQLTDIDFVGLSKQNSKIPPFFQSIGYVGDQRVNALFGATRQKYFEQSKELGVDVFFDKLEMAHTLELANRLELDFPTITLADLFLEKMEIVEINEKDIMDVTILLAEHELGDGKPETIDVGYITTLLSKDWGAWYTVTTNLRKVKEFLPSYSALAQEDQATVTKKIDSLLHGLENSPKSMSWRTRARIGPKKKWYRDVEAIIR
jgi:hypothetical protein